MFELHRLIFINHVFAIMFANQLMINFLAVSLLFDQASMALCFILFCLND